VPQLGAPGIAAHEVKRRTGFKVHYGPIRAGDIRPYLDAGMKTTLEMRQVKFSFVDRIVLAPLELTVMFKWMVLLVIFLLGLSGFHGTNFSWERVVNTGVPTVGLLLTAWITAGFFVTAFLPYLPGKMLSAKGLQSGLILSLLLYIYWTVIQIPQDGLLGIGGLALLITGISSYLGLVLTGSMPYTSISGVRLEMRRMVPVIVLIIILGFVLWTLERFV
jgi:acetyl-CoA decarbonylase/synthase complex subunit gamma